MEEGVLGEQPVASGLYGKGLNLRENLKNGLE